MIKRILMFCLIVGFLIAMPFSYTQAKKFDPITITHTVLKQDNCYIYLIIEGKSEIMATQILINNYPATIINNEFVCVIPLYKTCIDRMGINNFYKRYLLKFIITDEFGLKYTTYKFIKIFEHCEK